MQLTDQLQKLMSPEEKFLVFIKELKELDSLVLGKPKWVFQQSFLGPLRLTNKITNSTVGIWHPDIYKAVETLTLRYNAAKQSKLNMPIGRYESEESVEIRETPYLLVMQQNTLTVPNLITTLAEGVTNPLDSEAIASLLNTISLLNSPCLEYSFGSEFNAAIRLYLESGNSIAGEFIRSCLGIGEATQLLKHFVRDGSTCYGVKRDGSGHYESPFDLSTYLFDHLLTSNVAYRTLNDLRIKRTNSNYTFKYIFEFMDDNKFIEFKPY